MGLAVRAIRGDELEQWATVMLTAFHGGQSAADVAAFRREVLADRFERTIAAFDGERLVGTLESFAAELTLPGNAVTSVDAVSAVSVLATHRRRGALTSMLTQDLLAARDRGEAAAILMPSEYPIYGRFGFGPATTRVEYTIDTATARFTRAAAGSVEYIEPARLRELAPALFERFRRETPGQIDRAEWLWDVRLGLRETPWRQRDKPVRCAVHLQPDGEADGYLFYVTEENRVPGRFAARMELSELVALTNDAYLSLFRFCCEVDLISDVRAVVRGPDEPLPWLMDNPRAAISESRRSDFLWLRTLDTPRFLSCRRYASAERLVIEVQDPLSISGGRFLLEGGPDGATCRPTTESADLVMPMTTLGAMSLGGQSLYTLAKAGLIEEQRPGVLGKAERLFHWPVAPWCSTPF